MSWTRTAAGLLLHSIIHLRLAFLHASILLTALGLALLMFACLAFHVGRSRRTVFQNGLAPSASPPLAMQMMTAAGLTVCLAALVAIGLSRF